MENFNNMVLRTFFHKINIHLKNKFQDFGRNLRLKKTLFESNIQNSKIVI